MTGTDAAWPPDVGFVEYVQARQHTLLRAAYLVCGDLSVAESLLRTALVDLARQWDRVRDDGPDLHVRRVLYRAAVRSGDERMSVRTRLREDGASSSRTRRPRRRFHR